MAAPRRNVLADPAARDAYVTGVQSLKSEFLGRPQATSASPAPSSKSQPMTFLRSGTTWQWAA
jgi:hypothetical protein